MSSQPIPAKWAPYVLSITRIVFGFLLLTHGMEQILRFPQASKAAMLSVRGIAELAAFPAGILIMLGLFTRPVALVTAFVWGASYLDGPFQKGPWPFMNTGETIILTAFFFIFLAAAGGGSWALDRLVKRRRQGAAPAAALYASEWAPYFLAILRIAVGLLFWEHGLEKIFGFGGGRMETNYLAIRGFAGVLEFIGGPVIMLGIFNRFVCFILSGEMAVAYFRTYAPRGFWQSLPAGATPILYCYLYLFFFTSGAPVWSLDSLLSRRKTARMQARPDFTAA